MVIEAIMEITTVHRITSFLHTKRIDTFHYVMFHGLASRSKKGDLHLSAKNIPAASHLNLTLNSYRVSKIIQPSQNLLVSLDVAENLSKKFGIEYAKTRIIGVARIMYEEGNMDHWNDPTYKDDGEYPDVLLKHAAANSELARKGPEFVELLPYDGEIIARFDRVDSFSKTVKFEPTGDEFDIVGTKKALVEYGYVWGDEVHIFRDDIYAALENDFRGDYFEFQKLHIT
jgi:hypothetical protein